MPTFSFKPSLSFRPTEDVKRSSDVKEPQDWRKSSPEHAKKESREHVKKSSAAKKSENGKKSRDAAKKSSAAKKASALKKVEDAKKASAAWRAEDAKRQEDAKKAADVKAEDVKGESDTTGSESSDESGHVRKPNAYAGMRDLHVASHREVVDKLVMEEMMSPQMSEALKSPRAMPESLGLEKADPVRVQDSNEMSAMLFKRMLHQADGRKLNEKRLEGMRNGRRHMAKKVKTTFSSAANVVKRLIQLANFVRMNQGETHLGVLVAEFVRRKESLPKGSDTVVRSCWDIAAVDNFDVRGKKYLVDKEKVKAVGEPRMKFIAAHWLKSDRREDNLAGRPGSVVEILEERLKQIKGYTPFFFVINLQVPGSTTHSLALYYMTYRSLEDDNLLHKFVDGDDDFRNSRFKLIPHVVQGSWLVKRSVGNTPCLIGKALTVNYHKGKSYIELDIDIGSSAVAKGVVGLVFGYLRNLVVEMGFVIQAEAEEELPERLLGTCRLSYLDVNKAVAVEDN